MDLESHFRLSWRHIPFCCTSYAAWGKHVKSHDLTRTCTCYLRKLNGSCADGEAKVGVKRLLSQADLASRSSRHLSCLQSNIWLVSKAGAPSASTTKCCCDVHTTCCVLGKILALAARTLCLYGKLFVLPAYWGASSDFVRLTMFGPGRALDPLGRTIGTSAFPAATRPPCTWVRAVAVALSYVSPLTMTLALCSSFCKAPASPNSHRRGTRRYISASSRSVMPHLMHVCHVSGWFGRADTTASVVSLFLRCLISSFPAPPPTFSTHPLQLLCAYCHSRSTSCSEASKLLQQPGSDSEDFASCHTHIYLIYLWNEVPRTHILLWFEN